MVISTIIVVSIVVIFAFIIILGISGMAISVLDQANLTISVMAFSSLILVWWFYIFFLVRNEKIKKSNPSNYKTKIKTSWRTVIFITILGALSYTFGTLTMFIGDFLGSLLFIGISMLVDAIICKPLVIDPIKTKEIKEKRDQENYCSQFEYCPGSMVNTFISGVTFDNRQEEIKLMKVGSRVFLRRDPDNSFDSNAIQVFSSNSRKNLGFVPKEMAAKIYKIFDLYTIENYHVHGTVTKISYDGSDHQGIEISFRLPDEDSLRSDQEEHLLMDYPHF